MEKVLNGMDRVVACASKAFRVTFCEVSGTGLYFSRTMDRPRMEVRSGAIPFGSLGDVGM
jgi:hypothetical protein